jgi:hypothetical protein
VLRQSCLQVLFSIAGVNDAFVSEEVQGPSLVTSPRPFLFRSYTCTEYDQRMCLLAGL